MHMASKIWQRNMAIFLLILLLGTFMPVTEIQAAGQSRIYVSVERFTIGQGYLVAPRSMMVTDGETVEQVFMRLMDEEGLTPVTEISTYGFYLEGIKNADAGNGHVPACISAMGQKAPTDSDLNPAADKNLEYPDLCEFSYTNESGWCYFVNNVAASVGMGNSNVKDGDVIRFRFTLYGYGADLGGLGWDGSAEALKLPNLDAETKRLALLGDMRGTGLTDDYEQAWTEALRTVSDMDSTAAQIETAMDKLPAEEELLALRENYGTKLQEEITRIKEEIESIGTVTLSGEAKISEVRKSYTALPTAVKNEFPADVKQILLDAETRIKELKAIEDTKAKINAIGTVTLDKARQISEARGAYSGLSASAQKEIPDESLKILQAAEIKLETLKAAKEVEDQINAIGPVTAGKADLIAAARSAYQRLSLAAQKEVSPDALTALTQAEKTLEELKNPPKPATCTAVYAAGTGGTISGKTTQTVEAGKSTETVKAVPDKGYVFSKWSDGVKTADRTDLLSSDLSVTAIFTRKQTGQGTDDPTTSPVSALGITLNKSKITLGVKETCLLNAKVSPSDASQKVTWKSDRTSVAKVSASGKITAHKAGTATITAVTSNGKKASCKVTVKKAPGKITLNARTKTLKKGKTFQIKVKLPKGTASNKISYSSNKKSVATVNASGRITAKKKGKAVITVKTFNKKKARITVTVK